MMRRLNKWGHKLWGWTEWWWLATVIRPLMRKQMTLSPNSGINWSCRDLILSCVTKKCSSLLQQHYHNNIMYKNHHHYHYNIIFIHAYSYLSSQDGRIFSSFYSFKEKILMICVKSNKKALLIVLFVVTF